MRAAGKETEIKLAIGRAATARRRLQRLGFRIVQARSFEANLIFDTPQHRLRRRGCLLRLRSVNGRHWLTFKGPAAASRRYKIRDEWEVVLSEPQTTRSLLTAFGVRPWFRYEKYRTVLSGRGRWRGGEVMLDETPIGNYLELEGSRQWIRRVARALGATPREFMVKSYAALYTDWCRRWRRPFRHMVFKPRRKL